MALARLRCLQIPHRSQSFLSLNATIFKILSSHPFLPRAEALRGSSVIYSTSSSGYVTFRFKVQWRRLSSDHLTFPNQGTKYSSPLPGISSLNGVFHIHLYTLGLLMSHEELPFTYGSNPLCSPQMIQISNLASQPSFTILARPSHSTCPAFATVSNTISLYLSLAHRICVVDKACLPPSGMSSAHSSTSDIAR